MVLTNYLCGKEVPTMATQIELAVRLALMKYDDYDLAHELAQDLVREHSDGVEFTGPELSAKIGDEMRRQR